MNIDKKTNDFLLPYFDYTPYLTFQSIDLDCLVDEVISSKKVKESKNTVKRNLCKIVDAVIKASRNKNENKYYSKWGFSINTKFLRQNVYDNYSPYLDTLIDNEVILVTKKYSKGIHSTLYKFSETFVNDNVIEIRIALDGRSSKNMKSNLYAALQKDFKSVSVDLSVLKPIVKKNFEIDRVSTNEQCKSLYGLHNGIINHRWKEGATGRLYNYFSNLKKEYRSAVRIDGHPLVELDVRSSVPVIGLSLLYLNNIPLLTLAYNSILLRGINLGLSLEYLIDRDILYKEILGGGGEGKGIMCSEETNIPEDVDQYKNLVLKGGLYQYVADRWNHELTKEKRIDELASLRKKLDADDERHQFDYFVKDDGKEGILALTNRPIQAMTESILWQIFKQDFPNVAYRIEFINQYVIKYANERNKNDVVCTYAYLTQQLEVIIIVNKVVERVKTIDENIKMITLQDAIFTTEQNADIVKKAMKDVYKEEFGFVPQIKDSRTKGPKTMEIRKKP